jgi:hypothetical protein
MLGCFGNLISGKEKIPRDGTTIIPEEDTNGNKKTLTSLVERAAGFEHHTSMVPMTI